MASEEEQRARKEDAMPDLGLPSKREKIQPVGFQIYIVSFANMEGVIFTRNKTTTNADLMENLCFVR